MQISVIVDSHLRVDGNVLGHDLVNDILDELTIVNEAKKLAKRQKRYGWWDLPDDFLLGELDGDTLVMPRGYAPHLKRICREYGHHVIWLDRRRRMKGAPFKWKQTFKPRPHQPRAVKAMGKYQQGMYQAPTGSGKTVSCISFIKKIRPKKTIVLVGKIDLFNQWVREFDNWLGVKVGKIGAGKFEIGDRITVATVQTIWSKIKNGTLPEDFFEQFDCMILDECHHTPADTVRYIAGSFNAKWRIGVSATPDNMDDKFEIACAVLGEVFHEDDEEELIELGVLIRPMVKVVKTDFKFAYWPDHEAEPVEDDNGEVTHYQCLKPGCKKRGPHSHKNNYQQLKDAIVFDEERNRTIAEEICGVANTGKHHQLVITDEVRHLEAIEQQLTYTLFGRPTFVLTGKVTGKKREKLIAEIKELDECVVFATVAKEGLDIPVLDRIHLPFPGSNPSGTRQKVGRGTRSVEGKEDAIIFDYVDVKVKKLGQQFRRRRFEFYDQAGMEVVM